jgi:hypothetical protein
MIADVGGTYSSIFYMGFMLMSYFVDPLFFSSILKRTYQMEKDLANMESKNYLTDQSNH